MKLLIMQFSPLAIVDGNITIVIICSSSIFPYFIVYSNHQPLSEVIITIIIIIIMKRDCPHFRL
jgi:hypothetical protein